MMSLQDNGQSMNPNMSPMDSGAPSGGSNKKAVTLASIIGGAIVVVSLIASFAYAKMGDNAVTAPNMKVVPMSEGKGVVTPTQMVNNVVAAQQLLDERGSGYRVLATSDITEDGVVVLARSTDYAYSRLIVIDRPTKAWTFVHGNLTNFKSDFVRLTLPTAGDYELIFSLRFPMGNMHYPLNDNKDRAYIRPSAIGDYITIKTKYTVANGVAQAKDMKTTALTSPPEYNQELSDPATIRMTNLVVNQANSLMADIKRRNLPVGLIRN